MWLVIDYFFTERDTHYVNRGAYCSLSEKVIVRFSETDIDRYTELSTACIKFCEKYIFFMSQDNF